MEKELKEKALKAAPRECKTHVQLEFPVDYSSINDSLVEN